MSAPREGGDLMSINVVNLDALIPREDFAVSGGPLQGSNLDKITVVHLEGPFFGPDLRKPDFQRETVHWTPNKVVDLIRAFVDADLIPAVILWRAGQYIFVVDGAHRLSALLAWIHDDYGDRRRSLDFFGGTITDEQRKIAKKTRELVAATVGSYQEYVALRGNPDAPDAMRRRLSNLSLNPLIAQWVPATDAASAEASFFKINQEATPIDPTERRILRARGSASAIASRAITHGGTGHKYWADFTQYAAGIEKEAAAIQAALYTPPMGGAPLTTLDVPVAGRGYNALQFVFDLVNESNNITVSDKSAKSEAKDSLPVDTDGALTLTYLKTVSRRLARVTGDSPMSLGLHPVVYFYTRSGAFQPLTFHATSRFVETLAANDELETFTGVRVDFEEFLLEHKEVPSLIVGKIGAGGRGLPWLQSYYQKLFEGLVDGLTREQAQHAFASDPDFAFLTVPRPAMVRGASKNPKRPMSSSTKTATYFAAALPGCARCKICGARVHRNSVHFDHIIPVRNGGAADMSNAQVAHPYCDSTIKG